MKKTNKIKKNLKELNKKILKELINCNSKYKIILKYNFIISLKKCKNNFKTEINKNKLKEIYNELSNIIKNLNKIKKYKKYENKLSNKKINIQNLNLENKCKNYHYLKEIINLLLDNIRIFEKHFNKTLFQKIKNLLFFN